MRGAVALRWVFRIGLTLACLRCVALKDGATSPPEETDGAAGVADATTAGIPDATPHDRATAPDVDAEGAVADAGPDSESPEPPVDVGPEASTSVHYGGGRVLTNTPTLVAIYWGLWPSDQLNQFETSYEPYLLFIPATPYFAAISQYCGVVDGGRISIPTQQPNYPFQRYFNDPGDGGVNDPNAYIESLASANQSPDTIYVVFFQFNINLCGAQTGCSGLTPNLKIPYIRVQNSFDYVASSRVGFRELVNVITNSDGQGWTVPYQGRNYSLGDICSRFPEGAGLGSEAIVRLWDKYMVFGSDGMFSALSNGGKGACVDTYATRGLLATVGSGGGTTTRVVSLVGTPAPPGGVAAGMLPATDNIGIAAGPLGLAYDGLWTITPSTGLDLTWPTTNDLSGGWGASMDLVSLPAPFHFSSGVDVTMQGEARWDAFVVGSAPTGDAAFAPQLFQYYWDEYLSPQNNGWTSFGDATGLPGVTGIASGPGVTSFAPGRLDAFVLGATAGGNHLLRAWCDDRVNGIHAMGTNCNSATGWADMGQPPDGTPLVGNPDAASWPSGKSDSGHLAVAVAGGDGTIRLLRDDDGTVTWTTVPPPPGVPLSANPTITGMGDERYLIAARATDGTVWQWLYDWGPGTWSKSPVSPGSIAIDLTAY
jgi:hypothetical protein